MVLNWGSNRICTNYVSKNSNLKLYLIKTLTDDGTKRKKDLIVWKKSDNKRYTNCYLKNEAEKLQSGIKR